MKVFFLVVAGDEGLALATSTAGEVWLLLPSKAGTGGGRQRRRMYTFEELGTSGEDHCSILGWTACSPAVSTNFVDGRAELRGVLDGDVETFGHKTTTSTTAKSLQKAFLQAVKNYFYKKHFLQAVKNYF